MATVTFEKFLNVVNGELRDAAQHHRGINPHTEESLWPVPIATEADLHEAVVAARTAFATWRMTSLEDRRKRFADFAKALMGQKEGWGILLSKEAGQSQGYAESEVELSCDYLVRLSKIDLSDDVQHEDDEVKVVTRYAPLGIVAAICPWNFPMFMAAGKIASAVSTGNTVIVKPSPFTPYTALKMVELAQHFFPPGVVQVVGGNDKLGQWMTEDPGIDKISFTGSTLTGGKIMSTAGPTLKRLTLELGGNDPAIICDDVDIETVASTIAYDAFDHAGQTCVACKRIYVHESILEVFLDKFVMASKELKPGVDSFSVVQNKVQYDKVKSIHDDCLDRGYTFALGHERLEKTNRGFGIPPSIVVNPPEESRIVQEEPFGPIVPVLSWSNEAEVIRRANNTDQGLGAVVWCRDREKAERIASQLESGSVWINRAVQPMPTALFGGAKRSGIGGEWGKAGMTHYCQARTLHVSKQ